MSKPKKQDIKYIDNKPTQVALEGGRIGNPDKEGRFSVAHMKDGRREYLCDGKKVSYQDFFGATTGRDAIPKRIRAFGGIGEGTMRKAYESDEDYAERMKNIKE